MINKRFFQKSFSSFSFILLFLVSAWSIHAQTIVDLTVNGTWTVPCGVTSITVETWGAGGGGGPRSNVATGGGGGGAYAQKVFTVNTGDSFAYKIGAGGTGTTANNDGGDTWFASATTLMAKGGKGAPYNKDEGGAGGLASASIGDIKYSGGDGGKAKRISFIWNGGGGGGAAKSDGNGGNGSTPGGGSSVAPGGAGGAGKALAGGRGEAGKTYGGGGGGTTSGSDHGGAGAQGFIRITYTQATATASPITVPSSVATSSSGDLGCTTSQYTLKANGGNIGAGVSTLWYSGTQKPEFAYIQEFMGDSYVLRNATQGSVVNGNRTFTATSDDPSIDFQNILSSTFNPALHKYVVIRYRVVSGTVGNTEIYFKKGTNPLGESYVVRAPLNSDNQWHILTINMSNNVNWNNTGGNITGFRYDFATTPGVVMEIDYLVLSSQPILENTNADDSQISLDLTSVTEPGVVRIADQSLLCETTVPFVTSSVAIARKDKHFNKAAGNWSATANWTPGGVPNADQCVYVNNGHVTVTTNTAVAKSIHVGAAGKVTINEKMALTVTDEIINQGNGDNFVVKDQGNLKQENSTAVNTGDISVENLFQFADNKRRQYNYVSSPVTGQNLKSIYPGITYAIYHSENANIFYNSNGTSAKGQGLAIKEATEAANPAATATGTYKGVPNNGDINIALKYTTDNPKAAGVHGYNLVGNPYPSNIDLMLFYADNETLIEQDVELWDNRGNTQYGQLGSGYSGNNYATFNAYTGVGTAAAVTDPREPDQYLKVGLGFMVKALYSSNGKNLQFKNAHRVYENALDYHGRQAAMQADRFWLTLKTPSGLKVMNAVSYFSRGTDGISRDDSKSSDASDDLYTIVDDTKLVIQGKTPFTDTDVLSLGFNAFKEGNYTMHLHKKQGVFDNGQSIYLKDKETGVLTDLTSGDYSFTSAAGKIENRFEIVYKPTASLGTDNVTKTGLVVYRDAAQFVVKSNEKLDLVEVYDMSGRLAYTIMPNAKETSIDANSLNNGVYIIKVKTATGIKVKRIIK